MGLISYLILEAVYDVLFSARTMSNLLFLALLCYFATVFGWHYFVLRCKEHERDGLLLKLGYGNASLFW